MPGKRPFAIHATATAVEVWSAHQIQFDGLRRHEWQGDLVRELKAALAAVEAEPGRALTGTYSTTVAGRFDAENRLFTNPGAATFPKGTLAIRWERGVEVPPAPEPIADLGAGVHYYRYAPSAGFQVWAPDQVLATWEEVSRPLAADGSARPMWLAMREALLEGRVELPCEQVPDGLRFGVSVTVRARLHGPRSAPALSEALIDGLLCALHAGASLDSNRVAELLAVKLPAMPRDRLAELARERRAVFPGSPFKIGRNGVQLSPCDEFCDAGEVIIQPDPRVSSLLVSGRVYTLKPAVIYGQIRTAHTALAR